MAKSEEVGREAHGSESKDQEGASRPANGTVERKGAKKRKQPAPSEPNKQPRRSSRRAPESETSPSQVFKFLISKEASKLCIPSDEADAISEDAKLRTYTNSTATFSPFEELLCALILSRPISHRLGLRSIRTIFNSPYEFTNPKAIKEAGSEKRHQALWDAKTQHKQKTVEEMELLADAFDGEGKDPVGLEHVRKEGEYDMEAERDILKKSVKGLGQTGLDIFFRRIQWTWSTAYPFIDSRTAASLDKIGLPSDAEELQKVLDEVWSDINNTVKGKDEDEAKRKAFVIALERAIGADLESKTDEVLAEAGKT
ncbi:hypothetical protein EV356DRAFT_438127 [Viridothelium virens]|uniref:Uncharacterized protein n=1 Tax=Viridothelium virens TaxID=1048519 RepID=A0A6A6HPU8_VIRVR|nr:hypothetical protein EV356DRAFT_438127 [Viridothelium virens]